MEIIIAQHAGFCFGVRRAIRAVYKNLTPSARVYTLGPIIHNPQVVEELRKKGVIIEEEFENLDSGTVIIRSHGVPESVAAQIQAKGLHMVDATCPYVKRIHDLVRRFKQDGYPILIIGESAHPEVIGINGWCDNQGMIVYQDEDIERLPPLSKACVVVQTTITQEKSNDILEKLQKRIPKLRIFNTICRATSERQREAVEIAKKADVMIVIGGKNSSNTHKLYELCSRHCAKTISVETVSDILPRVIKMGDVVGITAGASTPDWIIKEVVDKMDQLKEEKIPQEETQILESTQETNEDASTEEMPAVAQEEAPEQAEPLKEETSIEEVVSNEEPPQEEEEISTMEGYEKTMVSLKPGQVVTGIVLRVTDKDIIVNVGYKSDGVVPAEEISLDHGVKPSDLYKEGDAIEVAVLKVKDEDGNVLLSQKSIAHRKVWKDIEEALNSKAEMVAVASEVVKGGLIAKIKGVSAFVPASQVSTRYVEDLKMFIGQPLRLQILEIDRQRNRVVASQKAILQGEEALAKQALWENIKEGQKRTGEVKRLTHFGAFVDIGGVDGLIHVSDLAWGHVGHPKEVVSEGQQVEVIVLSADQEKDRISLGLKQLIPHPWENIEQKYVAGTLTAGKVVRITAFGAFVELEPGVDGLVHISQISDQRVQKVEDVLKQGDMVTVRILDVKPNDKRISLSIREAVDRPVVQPVAAPVEPEVTPENEGMTVSLGDFFPNNFIENNEEDKEEKE